MTAFEPGQWVTVNPNMSCGRCDQCQRGRQLLCRNLTGIGSNSDGGFAELITVPADIVFDVDRPRCGCRRLRRADRVRAPRAGDAAATAREHRAGPRLRLDRAAAGAVARLRRRGARDLASPRENQLARRAEFGIDSTVQIERASRADSVRKLYEQSEGGYDYVVEATGSARVGAKCVGLTRDGGTVMVYGVTHPDDTFPVHPYDLFRREITIKGSFAEISSFPAAIAALRSGRVRTDGLITHRYGLDEYGQALDDFVNDKSLHKAVVSPLA